MNPLNVHVPILGGSDLYVPMEPGHVLFVVGPNGAGKSALLSHVARGTPAGRVKKISAHRQNWMSNDTPSLMPSQRQSVSKDLIHHSQNVTSRYTDSYADARINVVLATLLTATNDWRRQFIDAHRATGIRVDDYEQQNPSPVGRMNDVLRLGGLTVQIEIVGDSIKAAHPNCAAIGVHRLSDGERNAVLLSADLITENPGTLFIIDEPERHLHRAIVQPLLSALFKSRQDCSFIVATHEVELPMSFKGAQILILRRCSWVNEDTPDRFDISVLEPETELPDDLRRTILGSRRRIICVEGQSVSLDRRLYQLLLEDATTVPKGGCTSVIHAVDALRGAKDLHWLEAFGLIDRDARSAPEIADLQQRGIFALQVCSVESLFYGSVARAAMAAQQAKSLGRTFEELLDDAESAALKALDRSEDAVRLCALRCEGAARDAVLAQLPSAAAIGNGLARSVDLDVSRLMVEERLRPNRVGQGDRADRRPSSEPAPERYPPPDA